MLRVIGAGLLLLAGSADGLLEMVQLHHMPQAGFGWFWGSYTGSPRAWWPWLVIAHLLVAAGIGSGWRLALGLGAFVGAVFAAFWVWLTTYYGSKIFRFDDAEPYLVIIPLLFVAAYTGMTVACWLAIRRAGATVRTE